MSDKPMEDPGGKDIEVKYADGTSSTFRWPTKEEFEARDRRIKGFIEQMHREMGPLIIQCDEDGKDIEP